MTLRMCSPYRPNSSTYYWVRKRVPKDLIPLLRRRELKRSLGTRDPHEARLLAPRVCLGFDRLLADARRSLQLGSVELSQLKGEYFRRRLSEIVSQARHEHWTADRFESTLGNV